MTEITSTRVGEERDGSHDPESSQAQKWERQGMVATILKDHKAWEQERWGMATAIPKDYDRSLEQVEARSDCRFMVIKLEAAASWRTVDGNDSNSMVARFVVKQPENEHTKKENLVDSVCMRGAMYKYTKMVSMDRRRGNKRGNAKFFCRW
jgi:hypothetical protein